MPPLPNSLFVFLLHPLSVSVNGVGIGLHLLEVVIWLESDWGISLSISGLCHFLSMGHSTQSHARQQTNQESSNHGLKSLQNKHQVRYCRLRFPWHRESESERSFLDGKTYEHSIESGPESGTEFLFCDAMQWKTGLVSQKDHVLSLDHDGCDSEEYNAHEAKPCARRAARCHTHLYCGCGICPFLALLIKQR